MEVLIGIQREKVLQEVNKLTAFTARQVEGMFDRIAATTDEEKIVLSYLGQAVGELIGKLSDFSPIVGDDVISLSLPSTFDLLLVPAVSDVIVNYLVQEICDRWYAVTKPDIKRENNASSILFSDILNFLCKRNKPLER